MSLRRHRKAAIKNPSNPAVRYSQLANRYRRLRLINSDLITALYNNHHERVGVLLAELGDFLGETACEKLIYMSDDACAARETDARPSLESGLSGSAV